MQIDTIASTGGPGFAALGISPQALEEILPQISSQAIGEGSGRRAAAGSP